jgi:hypothetical protein
VYRILYRFLAALASLAVRSGRSKDLEIIVLRHQLMVLRRQDDLPQLNNNDRTLLDRRRAPPPTTHRLARHPRHSAAVAQTAHRRPLDPTHRRTRQTVNRR